MADSIREYWLRIKAYFEGFVESETGADILIIGIILLVGIGSFGLGRLSMAEGEGSAGIALSNAPMAPNPVPLPPGGQLVASRTGSKYYYPWCGGAKSIAEKNLIWFDTEAAAQKAGYTPASNCKGLVAP